MKILVLFAHPDQHSFNYAIFDQLKTSLSEAGHELVIQNLYELNFSCITTLEDLTVNKGGNINPDVIAQQQLIQDAQGLLFIYPVWWYGPPAILKGWIERTLTLNFAFEIQPEGDSQRVLGLLHDKKAFIVETTANDQQGLADISYQSPTPKVLTFCGIDKQILHTLYAVPYVDQKIREQMIQDTAAQCLKFFP